MAVSDRKRGVSTVDADDVFVHRWIGVSLVCSTCCSFFFLPSKISFRARLVFRMLYTDGQSGKEAIRDWNPHLIYVQGGNTFWLHHCLEKGDWAKDIIDACCCSDSGEENSSSPPSFPAVYVGVSAGAILAGESMQTACWKAWDDPSVVPGKETYGDWTDSRGLGTAGRTSFFPHMTEEWRDLTERKTKELLRDGAAADTGRSDASVFCLRDDQAFAVDGRTQSIVEL
mmetsp:Transcript_27808/g.65347  ORF Transcript_27808/g.65347 Transcript_27808/m.65347 type:complete len:228 (-) Transcript_27808:1792-2475(-)